MPVPRGAPAMPGTPEIWYVDAMSMWFALLLATTAQSAVPPPTPPTIKPARVCRESERKTGSHIRTGRRCMTEEQWRAEDERHDRVPVSLQVTEGQDNGGQTRPQ